MRDWIKTLSLAMVLALGGLGLAGCEDEGRFEDAGEEIDEAGEELEEGLEDGMN
jgi:hypothetical protein